MKVSRENYFETNNIIIKIKINLEEWYQIYLYIYIFIGRAS